MAGKDPLNPKELLIISTIVRNFILFLSWLIEAIDKVFVLRMRILTYSLLNRFFFTVGIENLCRGSIMRFGTIVCWIFNF